MKYTTLDKIINYADEQARIEISKFEELLNLKFSVMEKTHGGKAEDSLWLYCNGKPYKVIQILYKGYNHRNNGGPIWFKYGIPRMTDAKSENRKSQRVEVYNDYTFGVCKSDARERIRHYKVEYMLKMLAKDKNIIKYFKGK